MKRLLLSFIFVSVLISVPVFGQINWMSPLHKPGISFEATKVDFPSLHYWADYKFSSIVYDISARVKLVKNINFLCEIPVVNSSMFEGYYDYGYYFGRMINKASFGSPLVGLEFNEGDNGILIRLSTRFSTEEDNDMYTYQYGALSSRDRLEAFYLYSTAYYLHVGRNFSLPNHLRTQILLGSMLFKPKSGDSKFYESVNAELWGDYRNFRFGLGYHIQYRLTDDDYYPFRASQNSFDNRMEHQIGFYGALSFGLIHPGIHIRIPLDEGIQKSVDFSYGLNLTVDFSK